MNATAKTRRTLVAILAASIVAGAAVAYRGSGGGVDRGALVQDVEYHGGLTRQQSECIVDRLLAKFSPQQTRAIIDASVGKPDPAKLDALPADQRQAVGENQEPCGVTS